LWWGGCVGGGRGGGGGGGGAYSSTRLPKAQKCTAVENTFVKSATFDIAFLHGLDMHSLQMKLYSSKNNLAIDMTRHKAHLVYYFVPRNIPFRIWRYSPFRALTSLVGRLHSSLFSFLLLHPLIPSSCNASLWTTSAHLVLGLI